MHRNNSQVNYNLINAYWNPVENKLVVICHMCQKQQHNAPVEGHGSRVPCSYTPTSQTAINSYLTQLHQDDMDYSYRVVRVANAVALTAVYTLQDDPRSDIHRTVIRY